VRRDSQPPFVVRTLHGITRNSASCPMKRLLAVAAVLALSSLPACQCDHKPPVGPVQPAAQAASVAVPLA